jgi:hypothetical protein
MLYRESRIIDLTSLSPMTPFERVAERPSSNHRFNLQADIAKCFIEEGLLPFGSHQTRALSEAPLNRSIDDLVRAGIFSSLLAYLAVAPST